jgi:hypothetical protein
VMGGGTVHFLGAAVTTERHGPDGGDGTGGEGGREGGGMDLAEEERDGVVSRCSDALEAIGVVRRGLGDVQEGAENFGSLTTSKSKSSSYGLRTGRLGVL